MKPCLVPGVLGELSCPAPGSHVPWAAGSPPMLHWWQWKDVLQVVGPAKGWNIPCHAMLPLVKPGPCLPPLAGCRQVTDAGLAALATAGHPGFHSQLTSLALNHTASTGIRPQGISHVHKTGTPNWESQPHPRSNQKAREGRAGLFALLRELPLSPSLSPPPPRSPPPGPAACMWVQAPGSGRCCSAAASCVP